MEEFDNLPDLSDWCSQACAGGFDNEKMEEWKDGKTERLQHTFCALHYAHCFLRFALCPLLFALCAPQFINLSKLAGNKLKINFLNISVNQICTSFWNRSLKTYYKKLNNWYIYPLNSTNKIHF